MKNKAVLFFVCLSAYYPKAAATDVETVWLTDVTTQIQNDKRVVSKPDLPDKLSFRLKGKSHALTLNLMRNHQIDPNADIYMVQKFKDGLPLLEKMENLAKADAAYYQDRQKGAFMTARCIRKSRRQCDILINGNIRIGDRSYDLRPSEADVTSSDFLKITGVRGKRYILQEQANIKSGISVNNNGFKRSIVAEETNFIEKNAEEKLINRLRRIPYEQDKHNNFLHSNVRLLNRNVARLQTVLPTGEIIYGRTNTKNDKTRNLKDYYVDVVVLTDGGIWELFLSLANSSASSDIGTIAKENLREYFSHIMNGVDLLYKGIEDPSIKISVSIRAFGILQSEHYFTHNQSKVSVFQGQTVIDGEKYFNDLKYWDINVGTKQLPLYDQVILFTRHVLYDGTLDKTDTDGYAIKGGVCDIGRRVEIARVADYFKTTTTAAHELGHALGAHHDGCEEAKSCSSKDYFIMAIKAPTFTKRKKYTPNPWLFSNCSVDSFKRTLVNKWCVATKYVHDQDILSEWNKMLMKQPGERYNPDEQCQIINGKGSMYCGRKLENICLFMRCTDPETNECEEIHLSAATGTTCGYQMSHGNHRQWKCLAEQYQLERENWLALSDIHLSLMGCSYNKNNKCIEYIFKYASFMKADDDRGKLCKGMQALTAQEVLCNYIQRLDLHTLTRICAESFICKDRS